MSLILKPSSYEIKLVNTGEEVVSEKFSNEFSVRTLQLMQTCSQFLWELYVLILSVETPENTSLMVQIKVPCGFSMQFVLKCSDGSSHPISTYDVR